MESASRSSLSFLHSGVKQFFLPEIFLHFFCARTAPAPQRRYFILQNPRRFLKSVYKSFNFQLNELHPICLICGLALHLTYLK